MNSSLSALRRVAFGSLVVSLLGFATAASAAIEARMRVIGTPGGWALEFTLTNNLTPAPVDMAITHFGVLVNQQSSIVAPQGFAVDRYLSWYHAGAGGSDTEYNVSWLAMRGDLTPSKSVQGFTVHITDAQAPSAVPWFALAQSRSNGEYVEDDHFGSDLMPGFEGMAVAVPEPTTYALFGLGLAALFGQRLWRSVRTA